MTFPTPVFASFDELFARHDDDIPAAGDALRAMARDGGIAQADHRRFAWLVNHVIGEKQAAWAAAADCLEQAVGHSAEPACAVQRAVALLHGGQPERALALVAHAAMLAGCTYPAANAAVQLGVLQFPTAAMPVGERVRAFNGLLDTLELPVASLGSLAALLAGALNNITSSLMDTPRGDADPDDYRHALMLGARRCRAIWAEVGHWTNRERADYLVALCANRLQDHEAALEAAGSGLRTIEQHGPEDVDRAFLLLELARAYRGLGRNLEGDVAREEAMRLALSFSSDLQDGFAARAGA